MKETLTFFFVNIQSIILNIASLSGWHAVTMEYDLQGNRTKLTDPDAGISTASYNGFGQPVWEKMTNNAQQGEITTRYAYLPGGQLDTLNRNGEITKYEYDNLHRIKSVTVAGKHKQSYGYDAFYRDTCLVEEIDGRVYRKSYAYDAVGLRPERPIGYFFYHYG